MSSGDFDAIYDGVTDNIKASQSRLELWEFFQRIGVRYESCEAGSLVNMNYATNAEGYFVGLIYDRQCQWEFGGEALV